MKKYISRITILPLAVLIACFLTGCGASSPMPEDGLELLPFSPAFHEETSGTDTRVSIGSLEITLPLGWEIRRETSDEGAERYILADAHSKYAGSNSSNGPIEAHKDGYEHDIVITPYQIGQMPASSLQLAAEIKEQFPVPLLYTAGNPEKSDKAKGCWIYGENPDTWEEEYFLFSENESGEKELFHIQETSSYLTALDNDVESFRELMNKRRVWTDSGTYVVSYGSSVQEREYYFLLHRQNDCPLLIAARLSPNELTVYQAGAYETPLLVQEADCFPAYLAAEDIDRDGCEDLLCNYQVLNPQYPLAPDRIGGLTGYLWDEENHIFTYLSGEQMLEQYSSFWKNKQPDQEKDSQIIPEDLTAYLSGYILGSKEEMRDAMIPLASGQELDMERIKALAKENPSLKKHMLAIASAYDKAGIWLETDADNDGIDDIFLCESLGGSLRPIAYYLFKGTPDGDYILTDGHNSLQEDFCFIRWNKKNYLARTTWDFEKKEIDGLTLEYYENGKYSGGVWLAITAKEGSSGRSIQTSCFENEQYQSLKPALEILAMEYQAGSELPCGTAEEENHEPDDNRSCDINNDGNMEQYDISLWQTTNYYTTDHLSFIPENEEDCMALYDIAREEEINGTCMNLWVDETEYGNITYILYEEGLYDFHICGYLISGKEYRKLIQTDCRVQTEVTVHGISQSGKSMKHLLYLS